MKRRGFYISKCENIPEGKVYTLIEEEKVKDNVYLIRIAEVRAILIDRIILELKYDFLTEKREDIYRCFKEISFKEAKELIDNTDILLNRDIFRR